jgi:hypothetical protein
VVKGLQVKIYDPKTKRLGDIIGTLYPCIYGDDWKPVLSGRSFYRWEVRWSTGFISYVLPNNGYLTGSQAGSIYA